MAINFNYKKTIDQATQLEEIAKDLLSVANKRMATSIDGISAAWSGNSATEFLKYFGKMQEDIRGKANYLMKTAEALRQMAKTIKAAEDSTKGLVTKAMTPG